MKSINYQEMGKRIRTQRELLGLTREQLAEKLGVSAKFCSDIELGIKGVSIQTLMKLSELLLLNTDYILFGSETSNLTPQQQQITHIVSECPEAYQDDLLTIVATFVSAVSK